MQCNNLISQLAVDVWSASGRRTTERLTSLVEHFAGVYGYADRDNIDSFVKEAVRVIPEWKWDVA